MNTREFLSQLDHERIVSAIGAAEARTSGEIRVFVQRGQVGDAVAAAQAQFAKLSMQNTRERNGVLIFVAPRVQKFAVVGDEGVHAKCGAEFWQQLVDKMAAHFRQQNFTDAIEMAIRETGDLLAQHFPRRDDDQNELPDAVIES